MRAVTSTAVCLFLTLGSYAQKPATPAPTAAAATPSPSNTEMTAWLAKVDAQFRGPYEREVKTPYENGRNALKQQYLAVLIPQLTAAVEQARLDQAEFLKKERQRIFEGEGVPPDDSDKPPAALVAPRANFRAQTAKLESERARAAKLHFDRYDKFLADTQTTLAARQRTEDVALLKAKRDEIAKEWLPVAITREQAIARATPIPSGSPMTFSKAAAHETAEWLLEAGAELSIAEGNKEVRLTDTRPLASGRVVLTKVLIDAVKMSTPIAPAELKRVACFKGLHTLEVHGVNASDEDVAFLQQMESLESVSFYYANLTDLTVDALAMLPKLRQIKLHNAKGLQGKTLDKLARHAELRALELDATAVGDDAMPGLGKLTQLDQLHLARTKITNAALPTLAALPALTVLDISQTAITPTALQALKPLRRLEKFIYFDCKMTDLPDAVRTVTGIFPKLTTWRLSGDPLTAAGIEAMAQIKGLEWLTLSGKAEEGALAAVPKLVGLQKLTLINGDRTDADLEPLAGAKSLKFIEAHGKGVTDQFLEKLKKNRGLKELKLAGTSVTPAAITAFEKQVPGSKVSK